MFDSNAFNKFVVENGVLGFFDEPIQLKSGRTSHFYVNWRTLLSDVYLADVLADFVVNYLDHAKLSVDCIYGVPEGATKTGLLVTYKWAKNQPSYGRGSHSFSMGRSKPKEHGDPKDKYFVGAPKGKTLILEDVTTTGGSLIDCTRSLVAAGVNVVGVLSLTSRCEMRDDGLSVADKIKKEFDLPFHVLSKATELLPDVAKIQKPSKNVLKSIRAEFDQYGEMPIAI